MPYAGPSRTVRELGPYFLHHLIGTLAHLEQWMPSQQVLAAIAAELHWEAPQSAEGRTMDATQAFVPEAAWNKAHQHESDI